MAAAQGWHREGLVRVLSAGRRLELLPKWHEAPMRAKVLSSSILGRHQGDLVLSPPRPSLPSPVLGRPMEVTFLSREKSGPRRYGYYSMVLDSLEDFAYQGGSRPGVVVLFPRKHDIFPISLRQSRRFQIQPGGSLDLRVTGLSDVQLLDISIHGMRFSHGVTKDGPKPRDKLGLNLLIDQKAHDISGQVVGKRCKKNITEVSVELATLPLNIRAALIQALRDLEAKSSQGKGDA